MHVYVIITDCLFQTTSSPFNVAYLNNVDPSVPNPTMTLSESLKTGDQTATFQTSDTNDLVARVDTVDPTNTFIFNVTNTGAIFAVLLKDLDYETTTSYSVDVTLYDSAPEPYTRSKTETITFTITDVNDNAPIFTTDSSQVINIGESLPYFNVTVTDVDTDPGNITFSIGDHNITGSLDITAGRLSLSGGKVASSGNIFSS